MLHERSHHKEKRKHSRKPTCSNDDPSQPKIKYFFKGDSIFKGKINRHVYTQIPSSTIHSDQKVEITKVSLTDRWINRMCFIHTQ